MEATQAAPERLYKVKYLKNPSQDELRTLALTHTAAITKTAHGNLNKVSRNKSRVAQYTYVIAPEADKAGYSGNVIDPKKALELIELQKRYIEKSGTMIQIDGYEGIGERAVPAQWLYTLEAANIAGMQQVLAFPREAVETKAQLGKPFEPLLRVIYTPDHFAEGMPGRQAILVDLENYVTYIMGPDYFGESKKGMLRMLCDLVYKRGGLVMHAGAKMVTVKKHKVTMGILGLSGTGKTTTTFSKQGDGVQPVQDDMIVLWPEGHTSVTENGCFAKTFGLTPESEPVLYHGTVAPESWLENVYIGQDGRADFSKKLLEVEEIIHLKDVLLATGTKAANLEAVISGEVKIADLVSEHMVPKDGYEFVVWNENGRSIIPMSVIPDCANFKEIPPVSTMGILNRDEGPDAATPGLVRFASPEQAAGYLMLGETTKTSAAGKERGKTRSPFTQPFFPRAHGLQARRFSEIMKTIPKLDVWMMNTGYIGGEGFEIPTGKTLKVKIPHSSAMLEAMLTGEIVWKKDPDFGYFVVDVADKKNAHILARVPAEILNPVLHYEKQGRMVEYHAWVKKMKTERAAFLEKYGVEPGIVKAVVN